MQGIYKGYDLMYSDTCWSCCLDLCQRHAKNPRTGEEIVFSSYADAIQIIELSGSAGIVKK